MCVCVCVCFLAGNPAGPTDQGSDQGSQQRLIVFEPMILGVRGHVRVLYAAVCQRYHFLVFIVSQYLRKRTKCNLLLGR